MSDSEAAEARDVVALNVDQSALPASDKEAFAAAELRAGSNGSSDLSHKTIREIIDEEKKLEESERAP